MFPSFSVPGLLSDLSADVTTIGFDLPGGGYDRLHEFIESKDLLPASKRGRVALIAVMLIASRLVKQRLGPLGPVANFLNEIKDDGIREEAKRILESIRHATPPTRGGTAGADAIWELSESDRIRLLSLYGALDEGGKNRLHSHLVCSTAVRLATIAQLTPEQLSQVLDVLSPRRPVPTQNQSVVSGAITAFSEFLFPWMRPRTGVQP